LKTKENRIFICKRDDKIVEVWKGLIKHNFHSVPVLLKSSDKYYGIIDLHDISRFVLNFFGKEELSTIEDFWKHVEKSDKLKNVTVNDVMQSPLTRENTFKPVTTGYSLHFSFELMARLIFFCFLKY
jgi:predicted transcriptional regulator